MLPIPGVEEIYNFEFQLEPDFSDVDELNEKPIYGSFVASIIDVDGTELTLNNSLNEFKEKTRQKESLVIPDSVKNWNIRFKNQDRRDLNTYLHFGDDNLKLITNFTSDVETIPTSPFSIIYKLYEPLPDDVEEKDMAFVVREMLPELTEVVELVPYEQEDEGTTILRIPDSANVDSPVTQRQTQYKNYGDLVTSDARLKKEIEDKFLSGSEKPVELEIDYSNYNNFINFSSAERRLENFQYKMNLLQSYTAQSSSLVGVPYATNDVKEFDNLIRNIKSNLDGYETYLYSVSSSYVSSSMGEFPNASWPKTGSGSYANPYEPLSSSNAQFVDWYGSLSSKTGQIYSASFYDQYNPNRLVNLLPDHIKSDSENKQFLDFMDMVGQQFDELWAYTSELAKITDRQNDLSKGFSKDLTFNLAKSLGWDTQDGKDLLDLSRFGFGQKVSGSGEYSLYTSGSLSSPAEGDISKELTKRLIASMPYLLKTKGTLGSLKGILNCYGIPSSILRVREYGGPDKGTRVSYEVKRKFTYALDFHSSQYITSKWLTDTATSRVPDTVEFRFRTPKSQDMVVVQKGAKWAIQLQDNGSTDNYGYLRFAVSASTGVQYITSSLQPFYNDEMWSVMLSRVSASDGSVLPSDDILQNVKYELVAKQYDGSQEKIKFETSESLTTGIAAAGNAVNAAFTSSELLYLGGNGSNWGTQYSGSMMEFRLWSEPLSQSVFDNHVQAPKSYNRNSISSSYENFVLRLPLDENVNLNSSPQITNKAFPGTYNASGSAASYTKNDYRSLVDLEQLKVPNFGPSRRNATKIRIEDHKLTGQLSPDVRREKSSQDFAPIDSEKVGIYFSPVDVVNEDIMYSLADFNFDDEIGDPRDEYKYHYRGLRGTARNYWKKYSSPNNFFDYLRILSFYDAGVFTQTKALIPARAKASVGILIEPNILQRNKEVIGKEPEFDNQYYENANEFEEGLNVLRFVSGSKDDAFFDISSTYDTYNSELNLHHEESGSLGSLGRPTLVKIGQIDKKTEYNTLYATASVTLGSDGQFFSESIQPNINSSRLSEHNEEKEFFYSSSLSASLHKPYSASFKPSEYQSMSYDTQLFRVFIQGSLLTIENTIDSREPVEVNVTTPTTLITQEPGESKLKVK